MGRNKRLNYELIVGLHEHGYGQALIGRILETPNGHISKVLRKEGVKTRKRGEVTYPTPFNKLEKSLQVILREEDLLENYKEYTGFDVMGVVENKQKDWKSLDKKEKVEIIMEKLNRGMTTREAAKEIGIAQSTLVKTKNSYLKEVAK